MLERSGTAWADAEVVGYDGDEIRLSLINDAEGSPGAVPVEAMLVWTTDRGLFRGPVLVTTSDGHWRASFRGRVSRIQRREYVRLQMGTPMTLGHQGGTSRGTLVDLSEAALRARLDGPRMPALRPGQPVRAGFTLHRTGFMLRGTVLRASPGEAPHTLDVVVMLDIPARTANDLRRSVVYEQVERQAGPGPEQSREMS